MQKEKIRYYAVLATTLDGFIAKEENQLSTTWTSKEDKKHLHQMEDESDVLLLASKSYQLAKEPLKNRNLIVLTTKVNSIKKENEKLSFINLQNTNLEKYIQEKNYKKVCVLGGRTAYNYCLKNNLLDDIYITIEPIIFGKGINAFNEEIAMQKYNLIFFKKLNTTGTILLHYSKK